MKKILALFGILYLSLNPLLSQDRLDNKWSLSSAVGIAYSGGDDFGYTVDVNISRNLYKKLDVGLFFNIMNTEAIVNDLTQGFDGFNQAFTALDVEILSNFFHRSQREQYHNIGLQLNYKIVDSNKFQAVLGAGGYYSKYTESLNVISSSEPFVPFVEYAYFDTDDWRYHLAYELGYKINSTVTAGLKGRYLSIQDQLGSYVYISIGF